MNGVASHSIDREDTSMSVGEWLPRLKIAANFTSGVGGSNTYMGIQNVSKLIFSYKNAKHKQNKKNKN